MRRADRLIKLVHFLRSRHRAVTAKQIAEEFNICTRTVYRDIQDLMDAGTPITGAAGVGYLIDKQFYLPPITFDADELEALSLGISMVRQWTDENFAKKANEALAKIQAVLPTNLQGELQQITAYSIPSRPVLPWKISFSELREHIRKQQKLLIDYKDEGDNTSSRTIRPLSLFFFSPVWVLATWCEKRQDFRNFRIDRIQALTPLETFFEDEEGKNLNTLVLRETGSPLCKFNING